MKLPGLLLSLRSKKKIKKIYLKKNFIFQETELSNPKIKKVLVFLQKKTFLVFQETELFNPKNKKFQEVTF